jgi:dihydropteroate synthase
MKSARAHFQLTCCENTLTLGHRPLIMGILNTTPDSFSDGGLYIDLQKALDHAHAMVETGADIIDIGGESSRPAGPYGEGAGTVSLSDELNRTIPVIASIAPRLSIPISIDTTKAEVARRAIEAGATLVNDISALRFDTNMIKVVADTGAAVVLMHMQGTPRTMQANPTYNDIVTDILNFLSDRIAKTKAAGIPRSQIIIDPGFGFGKKYRHNIEILARLAEFHTLNCPILTGPSRKQFTAPKSESQNRLAGTISALTLCTMAGAHILRVHDVAEAVQAIALSNRVRKYQHS